MAKFISTIVGSCLQKTPWLSTRRAILLVFGSISCCGVEAAQISKAEYDLLPAYCRNQGNVAPNYFRPDNEAQWRNRLGSDFAHIHHYCWGMVEIVRAYKAGQTSGKRKSQFRAAIQDILFSIDRSSPEFVLVPEMYTKLGEAYLGLGDDKNAEIAFRKAWEVTPDYWPPYVWWAQRLLKRGQAREALAVAEEGIKNAPDSKTLKKLITEIRGAGKASRK